MDAAEELSIPYFRKLLKKHMKELRCFCKEWEVYLSDKTVPEEVVDEVRTAIGLTNLLLGQKLKQFGELIDDSELKRGGKEVTCIDLQGFWEMVFHEVVKIQKNFKKLEKCKSNNWVFVEEPLPKLEVRKKLAVASTPKVILTAKAHSNAAKQRLAEAKQRMMEAQKKTKEVQKNANIEIVVMAATDKENKQSNIVEGENVCNPVLETVQGAADLNEPAAKKIGASKSNKKNPLPQEKNKTHKRQKSEKTSTDKENVSTKIEVKVTKASAPKIKLSKSPKETTPLQCVTRSAMKTMLAQKAE